MRFHKSAAEALREPAVARALGDLLFEMPELEPWRWINECRRALERGCFAPTYTLEAVARAAGVRSALIRKYTTQGVRGNGRLSTDEEGKISLGALAIFASLHRGRAREIALKAADRLPRESVRRPEPESVDSDTSLNRSVG